MSWNYLEHTLWQKFFLLLPKEKGTSCFLSFPLARLALADTLSPSLSLKGMDAGSIFSIFSLSLMERK